MGLSKSLRPKIFYLFKQSPSHLMKTFPLMFMFMSVFVVRPYNGKTTDYTGKHLYFITKYFYDEHHAEAE